MKKDDKVPSERNDFDSLAKQVLSYKRVLAYVIKAVAQEYRYCTIEEIEKLIEPETKGDSIKGLNTEDTDINYGRSNYDLLFEVDLPEGKGAPKEKAYVIVNVEAHNPTGLPYVPVSRGVYYTSRIISEEKGTHFEKSEYNKIKKVYSIWLLFSDTLKESYINLYQFKETQLMGANREKEINYDLAQVVIIGIGKSKSENEEDIIDMMRLLFYELTISPIKRIQKLEEKYDIKVTKEVDTMCNLSTLYVEHGVKIGIEQGIEQGFEKGVEQGLEQGLEQGVEKGRQELIVKMLDSGLSKELISSSADISMEEIERILASK